MPSLAVLGTGKHGAACARALGRWWSRILPETQLRLLPDEPSTNDSTGAILEVTRGIDAALLCVFRADIRSGGLYYRLGACFRVLGTARPLVPILIDLRPKETAQTPLELFQCAAFSENSMRTLTTLLAQSLLSGFPTATADERFASSWNELENSVDQVPGPSTQPFEITLALPGMTKTLPYNAGPSDGIWRSTAGRMIAALPQLGFPKFEMSELRYMDLAAQEWIRPPYWLSRVGTSHLGLIHTQLLAEWSSDPREVAKYVKLALEGQDRGPTIYSTGHWRAGAP